MMERDPTTADDCAEWGFGRVRSTATLARWYIQINPHLRGIIPLKSGEWLLIRDLGG
jgi:hypothetical protein